MCRDWPKQLYMGSRAHMLDMTRTRRLHTPGSNLGTLSVEEGDVHSGIWGGIGRYR